MRVKARQTIRAPWLLGQQLDRPHLHFHIADANSPLGAEGMPFVFTH